MLSVSEVQDMLNELGRVDFDGQFAASCYSSLGCNCNHFSERLCQRLVPDGGGRRVPGWLNRAALVSHVLGMDLVGVESIRALSQSITQAAQDAEAESAIATRSSSRALLQHAAVVAEARRSAGIPIQAAGCAGDPGKIS